jgi:DNA-binding beta-propeller fold protein YncE
MKQKIIIGFSVAMLLLAVFLIARDLFNPTTSQTSTVCCGDDVTAMKKIDTARIGYIRTRIIETGMNDLSGIAINEEAQVYVSGNRQVTAFDTMGTEILSFTIDSATTSIALDRDNVYLGSGPRILNYNLTTKKTDHWKSFRSSGYITSLTVHAGFVYAADAASKRVLKYNPEGELVLEIGKKDSLTGAPGFVLPSMYCDVAFDAFDALWVVDAGRLQLENYNQKGTLRSSWDRTVTPDNSFSGCCNPAHMAILPDGRFVTYEKGIDKIKVFDPSGRFVCFVAGAGYFRGNTDFQIGNNNLVKDLATDLSGNIYVLDAYNRINIFRDLKE